MTHPPIRVGTLVTAKRASGVCAAGERGVCYELYQLGDRPGYGILFHGGGHDGFSPGDVEMFLDVIGQVCPEVADYRFANVTQLRRDFEQGRFAAAFPPLKTYRGYRLPGEEGTAGPGLVTVRQEGQPPRPLDPRFDLRRHADGLNWGFGGSGPAQLALALAADVTGDDDLARRVHQKLKARLVAGLPGDGWSLTEQQLRQAILGIRAERGQNRAP
jgi:Family of unknown function (DUF6166)